MGLQLFFCFLIIVKLYFTDTLPNQSNPNYETESKKNPEIDNLAPYDDKNDAKISSSISREEIPDPKQDEAVVRVKRDDGETTTRRLIIAARPTSPTTQGPPPTSPMTTAKATTPKSSTAAQVTTKRVTTAHPTDPGKSTTAAHGTTPLPDCTWEEWKEWSKCDCRTGMRNRIRNPKVLPINHCAIRGCAGEMKACERKNCPIDCVYSKWSSWSHCDGPCGSSIRKRHRSVKVPAANGGKKCKRFQEIEHCRTDSHGCA